jgi:hypothetical protein
MKTQLYRHFNADGVLLYVGIAKDAATRRHPFKGGISRTEIIIFDTKQEALAAEAKAIREEHPKLNVAHLPIEQRRLQAGMMSAEEYRAALKTVGLTQGQAAKFFDVSIRAVNGYANGKLIPIADAMVLDLLTGKTTLDELRRTVENLKPEDVK